MKKLISAVLLFLSCGCVAFAQTDRVMLRLRLSDRSPLSVNVDGRFYDKGTTALTLDNLRPGPHRITVYAAGGYDMRPERIYTGTIRFEPGTMNTAVVDVMRRSLKLRSRPMDDEGYADGNAPDNRGETDRGGDRDNSRSGGQDDVYGDRRGGSGGYNNDNGGGAQNDNRGGYNNDNPTGDTNNGGEGYGSFPRGRGGNQNNTTSGGGNAYSNGNALSQRDMDDLATRIKARITDTDKEQMMKNVLGSRSATTAQIRLMLGWFSFDSTRLDFAKWAYSHAADPKNYWKLEEAFSFSSSKEEFSRSISGNH